MEARLLPGLIADLEYWDDTALRVAIGLPACVWSVPFSLFALAHGHNPLKAPANTSAAPAEFSERMSEMIVRSHRVKR